MVVNEARRYMEATFEKLTPAKAQEMARSIAKGAGKEQVAKLTQDLLEWSKKSRALLSDLVDKEIRDQLRKNRARITEFIDREVRDQLKKNTSRVTELVRREVRAQMKALGVATKDDVDALRRRVRELERGGAPAKRAGTRKTAAKKTAAKKTAARKTPASAPVASTPPTST
jgi:polyhydroxyalkanoate synthesis regulator phasin